MITGKEYILEIAKKMVPAMAYREEEDFEEWQKKARKKLAELLGLPLIRCEDDGFAVKRDEMFETYRKLDFEFQSEPGYTVPCSLLIPEGITVPRAGVICLQGHSTGAHISLGISRYSGDEELIAGGRDFAVRAVKEGFCAIVMEQRYMGVSGGTADGVPACITEHASLAGVLLGRTGIGERVWDVQRLIDVIETHFTEYVDAGQIICMGNSGGGTTTFYASCLEDRIRMSIPSCSVCTYEDSIMAMNHCACNFVPNIRTYFNMGDLGCLIAPKALLVVCGVEDPIFPLPGVEASYRIIESAYKRIGKEHICFLIKGKGGHQFYPDDVWPVVKKIFGDLAPEK